MTKDKIVRLLEALYKDTLSAVRVDGGLSKWFDTVVGFMQIDTHMRCCMGTSMVTCQRPKGRPRKRWLENIHKDSVEQQHKRFLNSLSTGHDGRTP